MDRIIITSKGTTYILDGEEVPENVYRERYPLPESRGGLCFANIRPHPSDALAVHPRQVGEARESARRKGVPTEFLADGRPIMRSRAHQKAYLRAYGFFNKDGGYGD